MTPPNPQALLTYIPNIAFFHRLSWKPHFQKIGRGIWEGYSDGEDGDKIKLAMIIFLTLGTLLRCGYLTFFIISVSSMTIFVLLCWVNTMYLRYFLPPSPVYLLLKYKDIKFLIHILFSPCSPPYCFSFAFGLSLFFSSFLLQSTPYFAPSRLDLLSIHYLFVWFDRQFMVYTNILFMSCFIFIPFDFMITLLPLVLSLVSPVSFFSISSIRYIATHFIHFNHC